MKDTECVHCRTYFAQNTVLSFLFYFPKQLTCQIKTQSEFLLFKAQTLLARKHW